MRKSTLITTIAMIVVVVVALSTATYAWFTSATTSSAKQTISTEATSGLTIYQGKFNATSPTLIDWDLAGTTAIQLDPDEDKKLNGLWSPTAEIEKYITNNTSGTANISSDTKETFLNCMGHTGGVKISNSLTRDPTLIRVVNNKSDATDIYLTILINCKEESNKASKFAAAATTFYLNVQDSTSGTGTEYTLGYSPTTASATTAGTVVTETQKVTSTPITAPISIGTMEENKIYGEKPTYGNAGDNSTAYKKATSAIAAYEIGANQIILPYQMKIASGVNPNNGINLVLYSWIDGWLATDTIRGCDITVYYVLSPEPLTIAGVITAPTAAA